MSAASAKGADDQLAEVRRLYWAAQYEDALDALRSSIAASSSEADEYRVLCLLGLGRAADAERIVERIVLKNPLATLDLVGRSPKFAATYRQVRSRTLALVAQTMYGLARASFDAGNFTVASAQFKELLVLLEKDEGNTEPLSDLKMLAEGFSRLSHPQPVAVEPAPPTPVAEVPTPVAEVPTEETLVVAVEPPEVPSLATDQTRPFASWRPQVFAAEDVDVTPPVIIDQRMPPWIAPPAYRNETFRGALEILIDEDGLVASVKTVERTHPLYDVTLTAVAKRWQYEPAVKNGRPVKYRKVLEFTLRGQ